MAIGKLSKQDRVEIITAIQKAEELTSGEIRVHISHSKHEVNALDAAKAHFYELGMEKTRERNAVILYLNFKLQKFALYGDEGIHQRVGQKYWEDLVQGVGFAIREKNITHGIVHALLEIGTALKHHFPHVDGQDNQLDNEISES